MAEEKSAPKKETLGPASIAMHQAKSGNMCVRITYQSSNMLTRYGGYSGESEYFVCNSSWAMQRLERRLEDIKATIPKIPFEGEIDVPGTFEVLTTIDGKYTRILSVKKISEEKPAPPPVRKTYLDEKDDDSSFNFGYNDTGSGLATLPASQDLSKWEGILF